MVVLWSANVRRNMYANGNTADGNFLQMSQRDSITTYGGKIEKEDSFQFLCQGNGAGPVGWVGVKSMILQHQRAPGN